MGRKQENIQKKTDKGAPVDLVIRTVLSRSEPDT